MSESHEELNKLFTELIEKTGSIHETFRALVPDREGGPGSFDQQRRALMLLLSLVGFLLSKEKLDDAADIAGQIPTGIELLKQMTHLRES